MRKDDGRGFSINDKSSPGHGLNNLDYRIKQFNGNFKILSSPQNGCEINVSADLV